MVNALKEDQMTIHFHGGPIWAGKGGSNDELIKALYRNGGAFISFARPGQLKKIALFPSDIRLDNGAYSDWNKARKNKRRVDWNARRIKFYDFVGQWYSRIEWFLVPDVIEGTEEENDAQLSLVPEWLKPKAVPVWHSDESIIRLIHLAENYEWVAIGCCGPHRTIRTPAWEKRMDEAFIELYIKRNIDVKIHGLRMLDGRVLSMYPFASADSTNVAMNVPKTEKRFPEIKDKLARTAVLRAAIEKVHPPSVPEWVQMKIKEPAQAGFLLDIVQVKKMEITTDKEMVQSSYSGSKTPAKEPVIRTWKRPFLKWAGGKYSLLPEMDRLIPAGKRLIEPFVGGGAVFLNSEKHELFLLADVNADLINLYQMLDVDHIRVWSLAKILFQHSNSEEAYKELRDEFNHQRMGAPERAAAFLFLNRHCFNGLIRYNRDGFFNVGWGKYESPYFPEAEIKAFKQKSHKCVFMNAGFRRTLALAGDGDVVYCDPPYEPLPGTAGFTNYAAGGFSWGDQILLAESCVAAHQRGAKVLISNSTAPRILELYGEHGFTLHHVSARRAISSKGSTRETAKDIVATLGV